MTASSWPFWQFEKGSWWYSRVARETDRAGTGLAPASDLKSDLTSGLNSEMIPAGFEHPPKPSGKTDILDAGGANCGALPDTSAPSGPSASDIARVVEAWPMLPEAVRRGIVAMVEAARSGECSHSRSQGNIGSD
jgi:hypothetical protein